MQTEFNEIASIEAFLDGTLAEEAKGAFEAWRKEDPASESKIEAQQVLRDGMYALAVESYKEQLREWNAADKQGKDSSTKNESRILLLGREIPQWIPLAVAAVCLCFLVWTGITYADTHYSNQALAHTNYIQPIYPLGNKIGRIDLSDCPAVMRSEIRGSRQMPSPDPRRELDLLFFKGHCLYESGAYLEAAAAFRQVLDQESVVFEQAPNAYWHLVLSLIASEQASDEEAIGLLKKLPMGATSDLQEKAEALRRDLESGWRWVAS